MMKKKQGFAGQRTIELPEHILEKASNNIKLSIGSFTKVGFFPEAKYQYTEQKEGIEDYALIYCTKGYGVAIINHHILHISPGDFFLIPPNTLFSYYADQLKPWTIFWFFYKGEFIQSMSDSYIHSAKSYKGYMPYNDERIKLFNKIYAYLERGHGVENLTAINMCLLNLVSALVIFIDEPKLIEDKNQSIINSTILFMKQNCESNLSLKELAENVSLSVSHFSLVFKKLTGISPVNYYHIIKIHKACDYLKFSNILVKEISFKLGILDAHYFSRLFKKTMGVSPNQYRTNHAKY